MTPMPCSMFGAFDLREGVSLAAFKGAFDAFCRHLQDSGHVAHWRVWKRSPHHGYDADFPDVAVMVEVCFHSRDHADAAWNSLESRSKEIAPLHAAVLSKVTQTMFVLFEEV